MHKHEIDELLKRHCHISPLELCAHHWIPEGKSADWLLGFLQCAEVYRGIRELFAEEVKPQAYEILTERVRGELAKVAASRSAQDEQKVALAILISMIEKGVRISFLIRAIADVCGQREQMSAVKLLFQAARLLEQDEA